MSWNQTSMPLTSSMMIREFFVAVWGDVLSTGSKVTSPYAP